MKIPMSWLKQYVDIDQPIDQYASSMIMIGNGVEGYEDLSATIDKVVVGKIVSLQKHENADSLQICKVDIGSSILQIVTGATNLTQGDLVPVALDGSTLPNGKKIKAGKLRGERSDGMLCSGPELNIPIELYPHCGEEGIMIFSEEHPLGMAVAEIFGLDDTVIDFEVLANRPDCLSVLGIARESAVALGSKTHDLSIQVKEEGGNVCDLIKVDVQETELCLRYCARVIRNIKIEPSPLWMRKILNASGIRPINNIVDITNYVMIEMGQPMHAFDLSHVQGRQIIVRRAMDGEALRTLDEKDRILSNKMLVIADERGATGLAGMMGGEGSEITPDTQEVLLEAACFLGANIRQTGRTLGLRTESSGRFERGVNVHNVHLAIDRAAQLIQEFGAGEVVSGLIDVYPNKKPIADVVVKVAYIRKLTGVDIQEQDMLRILASLRIQTTADNGILTCTPPSDRADLLVGADIAEEVLRVFGYDNIPSTLMRGDVIQGKRGAKREAQKRLVGVLCGLGYNECKTYSFQSPKIFDQLLLPEDHPMRKCATLLNPLGEDFSVMRTTLLGSMLQTISLNVSRNNEGAGLFEIGARFLPTQVPIVDVLPEEPLTLALGLYGAKADFYAIKGIVGTLLAATGLLSLGTWVRSTSPYLHPGRSANLMIDGVCLAEVGEAHPDVLENFNIAGRAYIAEVDLEKMIALSRPMGEIMVLPRHPAVTRDVALVMPEETTVGAVMETIMASAGKLLEKVEVFDIYRGAPITEGYKSVAYTMTLRAMDRTLTEEEITKTYHKVIKTCEAEHQARLRG